MATPATNCIYRPRAPQPTMNPMPPAVTTATATATGAACQSGVRKNCGFPWWVVLLLVGLVVIALAWAWIKGRHVEPAPVVAAGNGNPNGNGNGNQAGSNGAYYGNANGGGNGRVKQGKSQTIRDYSSRGVPALFMFTVNGCTWCDRTKPEFERAAQYLNIDVFEVNRVNLDKQDYPKGYPYIFLLTPDGQRIPFSGMKRCAKNLIEFTKQHLGDSAVNGNYAQQVVDCNNA